MTTLEETPQDWSELSLKAHKLQKQRDQLLNDKKYEEAYNAQAELILINGYIFDWIYGKLK